MKIKEIVQESEQMNEGWKSRLAAAGLASAAAMAPSAAKADAYQDYVAKPIYQVQKAERDWVNAQRNIDRQIWQQRSRVGRDLENIPIGGIDQLGRQIRGSTDHPKLQVDPAWIARVQQAELQRQMRAQGRQRQPVQVQTPDQD